MDALPRTYSLRDVAIATGIPEHWLRTHTGEYEHVAVGRQKRMTASQVTALLEQLKREAGKPQRQRDVEHGAELLARRQRRRRPA